MSDDEDQTPRRGTKASELLGSTRSSTARREASRNRLRADKSKSRSRSRSRTDETKTGEGEQKKTFDADKAARKNSDASSKVRKITGLSEPDKGYVEMATSSSSERPVTRSRSKSRKAKPEEFDSPHDKEYEKK